MKKLKELIVKYPDWAALGLFVLALISVLIYAIYTNTAAIVLLGALVIYSIQVAIPTPPPPPSPGQIAEAAGGFLERACTTLKDRLTVFQALHFDMIPIENTNQCQYFPRWEWLSMNRNSYTIVRLALLRSSKAALSANTLVQERRVLRDLLADDVRRGIVPLALHSDAQGEVPTLYLLDITEDRAYVCFDFIWVGDEKTAAFVHRYDIPPDGGDADDQDF